MLIARLCGDAAMIWFRYLLLLVAFFMGSAVYAADPCFEEYGCRRYIGVGLGVVNDDDRRPIVVKQLAAMRAAKLDAIRSLAEQSQGITMASQSESVSSVLQTDKIAVATQGILQQVRFVKVEPMQPGVYQAVAELDIYFERKEN